MDPAAAQEKFEMSLREHLLAQAGHPPPPQSHQQSSNNSGDAYPPSDSQSPHDHIDPNIGGAVGYNMSGDSAGDDALSPAGKGKRELSTSKRAAQNRAAQRAFRQRKEGYIKKLEEQVKEFQTMETSFRVLQSENYQLREYILNLQSRLLESDSSFPPAPSHINLPTGATSRQADDATAQLQREIEREREREREKYHSSSSAAAGAIAQSTVSQLQSTAAQAGALDGANGRYASPAKRPRIDEGHAPVEEARAGP